MSTVETITTAIAELLPEDVLRIRNWLDDRAEDGWDAQIEDDERAGRLDALAERALAEHHLKTVGDAALLAAAALAVDWNRPDEDTSWAHLASVQ